MSRPRILRAAQGRRMPWKNGGGETVELLVHPPGAGLDSFDWRVSMAHVASDGPFSAFPGVDRTLTVLDGAGLDLAVADAAPVRLTAAAAPFAFPADAPCFGRLLGGPVTDLNVMTRRGRFAHRVVPLDLDGPRRVGDTGAGAKVIVVCRAGEIAVDLGEGDAPLGRHDALVLQGGETLELTPLHGVAAALTVLIRPG